MEDFTIPEFRGKDAEDYEEDSAGDRTHLISSHLISSHLISSHNLKTNSVPLARLFGLA